MANEKRLIYLEDAIALLEKDVADSKDALKTAYHGDKDEIRAEMNGVRAAIHILKHHARNGGTVEAVEVVHGEWERIEDDYFDLVNLKCSVCSEEWCFEDYDECIPKNYHYCPNCGAKMDGDGNA